jgi:hypothetical protein
VKGRKVIFVVMWLTITGTACKRAEPSRDANSNSPQPQVVTATAPTPEQTAQTTTPPAGVPERAEVERLVAEGSAVMREVLGKYPHTEPCIGDGSSFLMVGLPTESWSNLSPRERVALSYYVESRVPFARERPGRYLITPEDAPIFEQFVSEVRRGLCDTCWTIVTGPYSRDGGVSPDRVLLNGDGCTRCYGRGDAAGQLRQQTLGSTLPPITWSVGAAEGEPSCAGFV